MPYFMACLSVGKVLRRLKGEVKAKVHAAGPAPPWRTAGKASANSGGRAGNPTRHHLIQPREQFAIVQVVVQEPFRQKPRQQPFQEFGRLRGEGVGAALGFGGIDLG